MTIYKSNFSKANKIVIGFVFIMIVLSTIPIVFYAEDWISFGIVLTVNLSTLLLLLWLILYTKYEINQSYLYCKSGPFHKTIPILKIKKINHHNGLFVPVTFKPALSHIGLIITYDYFDTIYISPEDEKKFIEDLLQINPNIHIQKLK